MSKQASSRKRRAQEALKEAEKAGAAREKRIRWTVGGGVAIVCLGIIGGAVIASSGNETITASTSSSVNPDAKLPEGVKPAGDPHEFAVPYGSNAAAPVLEVWEDFQCPACGQLESARGEDLKEAAAAGQVTLMLRPTTFLDRNLRNDASTRAVNAWGCAIDQGKAREYHSVLFANQPQQEGTGWTDEALIGLGTQAGVADIDAFTQCVNDAPYTEWAANSTAVFYDKDIQGTPTVFLAGTRLDTAAVVDPARFDAAVANATQQP